MMRGRGIEMLLGELNERHTDPPPLTISGEGLKLLKVLILHQQTNACNASLTCTGSTYTKISVSLQSISSKV